MTTPTKKAGSSLVLLKFLEHTARAGLRRRHAENVIDALRLMLAPDDDDPNVTAGRSERLELILAE